jgi:monoterpene epsilon-lactone hydrolase
MASEQLQSVIQMLRAGPMSGDADPEALDVEALRQGMEAMTGFLPPPEGTELDPVDANGVSCEWTSGTGARDDRALLYLHGGGYVIGSVRTHRGLVSRLSSAAGIRCLSVDYRLAPEHPHPAAVEDATTAYRWLLDQGIAPERVAIAGDSAGGGLTAATLLALRDVGDPLPAAGVLLSPWTDMGGTGESMVSKAEADPMVQRDGLMKMAAAYLGGLDAQTPLASPLHAKLEGLPPLLIHVGTSETLLDDSTRFAEAARAAQVDVTFEAWDEMIHVWHAFAPLLPEAQQAIDGVGAFLRARLG